MIGYLLELFRKKRAGYEFNRPINVVLVKEIEKKFEKE